MYISRSIRTQAPDVVSFDGALKAYSSWLGNVCGSVGVKAHADAGTQILAIAAKLRQEARPDASHEVSDLMVSHARLLEAIFAQDFRLLQQGKPTGDPGPHVRLAVTKQQALVTGLRRTTVSLTDLESLHFEPKRSNNSGDVQSGSSA